MRNQILVSIAIATLMLGIAIPLSQNAFADHSQLKFIIINKINNGDFTGTVSGNHCQSLMDQISPSNGESEETTTSPNCSSAPNGATDEYSKNSSPHLFYDKSLLAGFPNNRVNIQLYDNNDPVEGQVLLDSFFYTLPATNIDEVQLRICTGPETDNLCSTRVAAEVDLD